MESEQENTQRDVQGILIDTLVSRLSATQMPTVTKLVMTAHEVARALDISVRSVWRMSERGDIPPPIRIGRNRRWRRDTIEQWLEDQERKARAHTH